MTYLLLFLSVFLGYAIALFLKVKEVKSLSIYLAFSGAFLLALTIFELLPEVYENPNKSIGVFIIGGILLTLLLHMLLAKVGFVEFFRKIYRSGSKVTLLENGSYDVKLKGISNFLYALQLDKLLVDVPLGSSMQIDLSQSRLVDLSIMENLIEIKRMHDNNGGDVKLVGLDNHVASTSHNRALKIITGRVKKRITKRQIRLQKMAIANGWSFEREVAWNTSSTIKTLCPWVMPTICLIHL